MATQYTGNPFYDALADDYIKVQQAQANRPVQTSAYRETSTTPWEYSDLLARRNQIGAERARLNEALKQRETFGYGLANALASMPAQQGAGSWLGDFARGFGSAFNARANAAIDRAKQDYETAKSDLATALAFDKAMGDRQTQTELMGYSAPSAVGGTGGKNGDGTGNIDSILTNFANLPDIDVAELNEAAGRWETNTYQPDNPEHGYLKRLGTLMLDEDDYGIARSRGTKQAKAYQEFEDTAFQGMFDVLKALRPATDTDVLVALRSVGADPVAYPETRDIKLTGKLNAELAKGGFEQVKNLRQMVDSVRYAREFGEWSPQKATEYFTGKRQQQEQSRTNNLKLDGVQPLQITSIELL
jgi:hypothetical protein